MELVLLDSAKNVEDSTIRRRWARNLRSEWPNRRTERVGTARASLGRSGGHKDRFGLRRGEACGPGSREVFRSLRSPRYQIAELPILCPGMDRNREGVSHEPQF